MDIIVFYLFCLSLGGAGAWAVSRWGPVLDLLDRANHRSSHDGVVPKGGGIGILAAFVFSALGLKVPAAFWVPATFVALFSLYGDKVDLSPKVRLPVQFMAALFLLSFMVFSELSFVSCALLNRVPFQGVQLGSSVLCLLFSSVFIVGTANYYNFMDGINGIAGITGVVAFGLIAVFGAVSGAHGSLILLSLCMGFACLGFLPFNMPKARVFMGDVGSVLLGFVFAGLVVALSHSFTEFIVLCAFLFPFYADELTATYVRLRDGENLLRPHRRHIYQILANEKGIAHWKVSVGYGLFQAAAGLSVLWIMPFGLTPVIVLLAVSFSGFVVFGSLVRRSVARPA